MSEDTHALLERLVGQFASPYDFLRELVQNAMDAGSDLVEVELHVHPGDHSAEVIFELVVVDGGAGMDEEIIDGELTRLFGTSKTDDRTMAGGFGIGFVSVFAWEPERVLVQTGRQGDAWELLFHEDRRFEKRRVQMPVEGTTIRLFRRGAPSQRGAIAEAIEDALRRWCRFVPIEVTFDDVETGEGPHEIAERFEPEDVAAAATWERGPTRVVLGFGPEPEAVLLRRGLVLEEGRTADLLPVLAEAVGPATAEHLVARVDSPNLRTGLARDGVVRSDARDGLEAELAPVVLELRNALLQRLETVAGRPTWDGDGPDVYSHLHAHLQLELEAVAGLPSRPVLRLATGSAVSLDTLRRRARLGVVAVTDGGPLELRLIALRSGIPVLQGRWAVDGGWMQAMLSTAGLQVRRLEDVVSRAEPRETPPALVRLTLALLGDALAPRAVQWGALEEAGGDVLGGVALAPTGVVTGVPWTSALVRGRTLWLCDQHPVVQRASKTALTRPDIAALGLAAAILSRGDASVDPLVEGWRRFE